MTVDFKKSSRLLWQFEQFKGSLFVNGLIYYLGRIPLIGKYIPTSMLYSDYSLKKIIAQIKIGMGQLMKLVSTFIGFFISFGITKVINMLSDHQLSVFFVWFLLFPVLGSMIESLFLSLDRKEIQFTESYHVSRKEFLISKTLLTVLKKSLFYLVPLLVFGFIEENVMLYVLVGFFGYMTLSLFWAVVSLRITAYKKHFQLKLGLSIMMILISSVITFACYYFDYFPHIEGALVSWLTALLFILFSIPCLYAYVHFKDFDKVTINIVESSMISISKSSKEEQSKVRYFGEGQKMQSKMAIESDDFSHLKGQEYLNALLFSRFKRTLRRQLLVRVLIISAIMLAMTITARFAPVVSSKELESLFYALLPSMFFVMFVFSFGKKVVQVIFMNCDASMLAYPFYREAHEIRQGFTYRFFKLFYYNGMLAVTFFVWLLIFNSVNGWVLNITFLFIYGIVLLSLVLFFSFHELFVYYILQPFTSQLEVVNPVYKFVDGLFYGISYISLQIKTAGFGIAMIFTVAAILYVSVGFIIIMKVAPKTFKLKS